MNRPGEPRIGNLRVFEWLRTLTLQTSYIFGHDSTIELPNLWKQLPSSLETFRFARGEKAFPLVLLELQQFATAQEDGYVPKLKKIIIKCGTS